MMPDDIRDLLGRYSTGSLTADEQKRLFDAALDDQELFDELAREDEIKQMLAEPGVRDRLIRALEPPKRRVPWVLALAPVAVLSALLIVVLMRPVPKPQQVAVGKPLASPVAPVPALEDTAVSESRPASVPVPVKKKAAEQPQKEATIADATADEAEKKEPVKGETERKDAGPKAMDQVAAAAPATPPPPAPQAKTEAQTVEVQAQASQVQVSPTGQQNAPGGPKQNALQASRALAPARSVSGKIASIAQVFGFHYSIQTPGHLIMIPSADGYLSVKSGDGAVLFTQQRIAAGISTDLVLSDSVRSLTILFSADATPGPVPSTVRTASAGTAQAPSGSPAAVAIELRINP